MASVFVIRGFDTKVDSDGNKVDFERVHAQLIKPAIDACGLTGGTTEIVADAGNIRADMFELIIQADVVICDITIHNANVFYELGIRHSLRKKHTVLIKGTPSADRTPFDVATDKYMQYSVADPAASLNNLIQVVSATINSSRETDSPVFLLIPALAEADRSDITVTPIDLIEEIERAEAVSDIAWLRVIAEDLTNQRFELEGLRRVGQSQWEMKDWDGARDSWEKIKSSDPDDYHANSALANIYERQYRNNGRAELLEMSQQAIRRVLDSPLCTQEQRAEMLALKGRNLKTLWRATFEDCSDTEIALKQANDARAIDSYECYRSAFNCDLNAFYPGLATLQMGHILLLLAEQDRWNNLFKGKKRDADRYREDLLHDLPAFTHVVKAAIARDQQKPGNESPEWADVAEADLLVLELPDDSPVGAGEVLEQAYRDAIPDNKRFVWDASIGQLELFQKLGFKADAVAAVMDAFSEPPSQVLQEHLVVFAGHTFDWPGKPPRFPASAELKARALIFDAISCFKNELREDEYLTVLASAAPGADILVHEVCMELGVATRLCLPMPADKVAGTIFDDFDALRSRFFEIVRSQEGSVLQMAVNDDLPRWLQNRDDVDVWERGNRWVMQLAQTSGAAQVSMLAFWDGEEDGQSGGTAQFVQLARELGRFDVKVIDCNLATYT